MLLSPPTIADYKKRKSPEVLVNIDTDKWKENQAELYNIMNDMKELDTEFKLFIKSFIDSVEYNH